MALLLTEPYDPVKQTRWVGEMLQNNAQLQQRREELAAQERQKDQARMQAEIADTRRAIEIQQRQEYTRAENAKKEQANAYLNENYVDRLSGASPSSMPPSSVVATDPAVSPPSSALISASASPGFSMNSGDVSAPAIGGGEPIGKVTDYGQADDPHGDSASLGKGNYPVPTGAWDNPLSPTSFAASPDVEEKMKAAGIAPRSPVQLKLADGSTVVRTWDDRTMQDADAVKKFGAPLRGRFDFFNPGGASPHRDKAVVGFSPVGGTGGGSVAAPIDGELPTGGATQSPSSVMSGGILPNDPASSPAATISRQFAQAGLKNRVAQPALASAITRLALTPPKQVNGEIVWHPDGTGTLGNTVYRRDKDTQEVFKVGTTPKASASAQMIGQIFKTPEEANAAAKKLEEESGDPTFIWQSPKTGGYTLKQATPKQNDEVKAKAREQMGLFKSQISDAEKELAAKTREIAAFEKPDSKNPTSVFSSTTGIFTAPDGKKRFGQANVEANAGVEATDALETSYQKYLTLKSQAKELEAKKEAAQKKRDAFEELADKGVKGDTYRKSLEVAEGGPAPAEPAGDKPKAVKQNGVVYHLQPDGSYK